MKNPVVYILASADYGTLYIGVTSDIRKRMWRHENNKYEGFTNTYDVKRLVYYERHPNMESAIKREKQLKKWKREWKIRLINQLNPKWESLWHDGRGLLISPRCYMDTNPK